jgi:hypothetical protein
MLGIVFFFCYIFQSANAFAQEPLAQTAQVEAGQVRMVRMGTCGGPGATASIPPEFRAALLAAEKNDNAREVIRIAREAKLKAFAIGTEGYLIETKNNVCVAARGSRIKN